MPMLAQDPQGIGRPTSRAYMVMLVERGYSYNRSSTGLPIRMG